MKPIGRVCYEAYAAHAEWKTFDGRNMPQWDGLPEHVQAHWQTAAKRVQSRTRRDVHCV